MSGPVPFFSLVTPMYNRATTVGRAIQSALGQTDGDFELLVVDDCSSDESVSVVKSYGDSRIRLFMHDRNRGPCPARNTAIAAARGQWCVMLDSDFALLPGALAALRARAATAPPDVGNLASSCRWDDGTLSPRPARPTVVLDFPGYLAWLAGTTVSEKLECIRRSVFHSISYADSRAWEFAFHLDLASEWRIEISNQVLVTVYSDAPNRLTAAAGAAAIDRVLEDAPDKLASFEGILGRHSPMLHRWAPGLLDYVRVLAGVQATFLGRRGVMGRHVARVLARKPWNASAWSVLALSLLGRRGAAWATVQRRRWLAR